MVDRAELAVLAVGIAVVVAWTAFIVPEHKNENSLQQTQPPSFATARAAGFNAPSADDLPAPPDLPETRVGLLADP